VSAEAAPQEQNTPPNAAPTPEAKPQGDSQPESKKAKRPKLLLPIIGVLAVLAALYGYRSWSFGQTHASTDDAQVASRISGVAPRVAGTVTKVYVTENQYVRKGDPIVDIDPANYQTAVDQAKANLALAVAQAKQAAEQIDLTGETGDAQITQAEGGVGQNQAGVGTSLAQVAQAQAAQATAQAQFSGAEANVKATQAGYTIAVANVARAKNGVTEALALATQARAAVKSAQAAVTSARATETNARQNNERFQQLVKEGAVSQQAADQTVAALRVATGQREAAEENVRSAQATAQQRDAAVATAQSGVAAAQAQVAQANAQVQASRVNAVAANEGVRQAAAGVTTAKTNVAQAQAKVTQAKGTLQQANTAPRQIEVSRIAKEQADARVAQAKAALAQAQLNFGYTKIVAPVSGRVSTRIPTIGQEVAAGNSLVQIVPEGDIYVVANFKETQLGEVKKGQPVEIEVDALGGKPLRGHVDSLQPGTGATYALLPPDNATGNFTKVVQRIPVKITFDPGQDRMGRLAVGMSVVATIDTAAEAK